ncbi:hypothetical protein [Escherichia coli]|uniref:hypothetical protein n=1 Tax=Escherichia coli TaxID=562 RepID=UPI000B7E8AD6|nr:hypothetical protein [Escherichia coli]EEX1850665.1 hypothetical protein [Escherichia coli]EHI1080821.1 hypothetical protein [Escherichia coli]EIZ4146078.1 hypothetical protein [Escherichia coli]
MTVSKPMTSEQLDELMTVAVNMQRDSEKAGNRPSAMFAYAVQVAVLELRKVRDEAVALAAESAGLKAAISCHAAGFTVCEACGEDNISANDDVCRALNETPSTDAFLAEVWAQGVEMMVEQCESDIMLIEPEDEEHYTLMIEHAKEFAAQIRKGAQS